MFFSPQISEVFDGMRCLISCIFWRCKVMEVVISDMFRKLLYTVGEMVEKNMFAIQVIGLSFFFLGEGYIGDGGFQSLSKSCCCSV